MSTGPTFKLIPEGGRDQYVCGADLAPNGGGQLWVSNDGAPIATVDGSDGKREKKRDDDRRIDSSKTTGVSPGVGCDLPNADFRTEAV
jgi:hypothetical protein